MASKPMYTSEQISKALENLPKADLDIVQKFLDGGVKLTFVHQEDPHWVSVVQGAAMVIFIGAMTYLVIKMANAPTKQTVAARM